MPCYALYTEVSKQECCTLCSNYVYNDPNSCAMGRSCKGFTYEYDDSQRGYCFLHMPSTEQACLKTTELGHYLMWTCAFEQFELLGKDHIRGHRNLRRLARTIYANTTDDKKSVYSRLFYVAIISALTATVLCWIADSTAALLQFVLQSSEAIADLIKSRNKSLYIYVQTSWVQGVKRWSPSQAVLWLYMNMSFSGGFSWVTFFFGHACIQLKDLASTYAFSPNITNVHAFSRTYFCSTSLVLLAACCTSEPRELWVRSHNCHLQVPGVLGLISQFTNSVETGDLAQLQSLDKRMCTHGFTDYGIKCASRNECMKWICISF